ncbi:hypothetical protein WCLP8_560011 [uncultured Gammaproteobacteria bacterium]
MQVDRPARVAEGGQSRAFGADPGPDGADPGLHAVPAEFRADQLRRRLVPRHHHRVRGGVRSGGLCRRQRPCPADHAGRRPGHPAARGPDRRRQRVPALRLPPPLPGRGRRRHSPRQRAGRRQRAGAPEGAAPERTDGQHEQADGEAEAAGRRREEIREQVRVLLRELGTRKVEGDGFSISWFPVKGRKSLDRKAAERAGLDLARFEREGDPSERLTITLA